MLRRHFFLVGALVVLAIMLVAGALRLTFPAKAEGGSGGGQPAASAGPGAAARGTGGPGGMATVSAAAPTPHRFADRIDVLGVAKGRESVTITSNTTELVTRVRFRPGQFVRTGEILVDLKATEQDANVMVAKANFEQARRQNDRWTALAERGVAPKATAEQYQASYEAARASLEAAQSRRADRAIKAPFSGVVGLSDIAPGALINPGAPVVTLDDISVIRVDFDIPDRYLSLIRPGQPIVARPDALPGETFQGRIAMLNTRVDEKTRSIRGRAEFPNPGGRLRPGMLIHVGIDRGQRQSLSVTEAAVLYEADKPSVFVIATRNGKTVAEQRPVTLGENDNGVVEILKGLQPGERVIADGLNRINPGQPVRVVAGVGAKPGRPT